MASAVACNANASASSSTSSLLIDGVDIDTCTDDYKLNEMLDNCNDYEGRRRIRARIKVLLTTNQADSIKEGPTGNGKAALSSSRSNFGSLSSKTEVTTRQQSSSSTYRSSHQPNQSAFSKFQQLDQQQVKSTPSNGNASIVVTNITVTSSSSSLSSSAAVQPTTDNNQNLLNATNNNNNNSNQLAVPGSPRPRLNTAEIKERLLRFCQRKTAGYQNIQIENFSSSWNDGLAFCALIHNFYPDAFDYSKLEAKNKTYNFTLAFKTAEEKAGIAPLLDVEDMVMMSRPDWKCVFTYVQSFYRRFKDE